MLEPEPAKGEEEGGEVEEDQAVGGAEEGEEEGHPSVSEEAQELPESLKPKMKLFSGNLAAGLRIRAEPSFLVSKSLIMCLLCMHVHVDKHVLGHIHGSSWMCMLICFKFRLFLLVLSNLESPSHTLMRYVHT